ncbi:hypothetical protein NP493_1729g00032 [Ridgeia piscesae]|uniref:Uncharacterized protein n=1 Tax=Ridgeia piscesae TaxID=27915 RepID=A0AAD9N6V1_RIDPI|nr:hypothetical protein NP493_1729g00032 [Ridgeia piscesae]
MVCFMGFLHIEVTFQYCIGKLLTGSGCDRIFSLAGIFTTGIATSLLAGRHVKRTRYAYQLTLAWLHILKVQAYDHYCRDGYGPHEHMEMWEERLISNVNLDGGAKSRRNWSSCVRLIAHMAFLTAFCTPRLALLKSDTDTGQMLWNLRV